MSYILIVDDEPDILDMLELISTTTTQAPVFKASSGQEAIVVLNQQGSPSLIISDYKMPNGDGVFLYSEVQKLYPSVPFIVCSGNPKEQLEVLFPVVANFIQKPNMMKPLREYLEKNFQTKKITQNYVQLPLGYLKRLGVVSFDTYVRLNEGKFIKLHQAGDALDKTDYDKIENKFLNRLYLEQGDALNVVKEFEAYLTKRIASDPVTQVPSELVESIIPSVALLCKSFGWSQESLELAQKTVNATLQFMKKNKSLDSIFRMPTGDDLYSSHVSKLCVLTCVVASNLGWHHEATQEKLVMAALLHDHFVDESLYEDLEKLKMENSSPSAQDYKNHPFKAAELARSLKGVPINVDSIIMEHHESPNGDGFPRGLSASRISALGALFIVCQAIVTYSHHTKASQISMDDFIQTHPEFMQKDPFKKIMTSLKK